MRPWLKTAIRLLIESASPWSWVTKTNVMPTSRWMVFSSTCISSRSLRSSAPSGSSRSSTLGRFTSARASATRWRCPPDISWGLRVAEAAEADRLEHLGGALAALGPADALHLQAVLDVLLHGEVREQRVVLEDGVDVAVVGRRARDVLSAEQHRTARRQFEPGDHAQHGGLARPRRPEQREELALADLEVDVVDRDDLVGVVAVATEGLAEAHELDRRHLRAFTCHWRRLSPVRHRPEPADGKSYDPRGLGSILSA